MVAHEDQMDRIKAVQEKYTPQLLNKPHVVGVSIGRINANEGYAGDPALVVLVDEQADDAAVPADRIPQEIEGVPVVIRQVGSLKAY